MLAFIHIFFPRTIFVEHMRQFETLLRLTLNIGTVDGWIIVVFNNRTVSLSVFFVAYLVLFIERYWQRSGQKNDRYNADLRGTHHFRFLHGRFHSGASKTNVWWIVVIFLVIVVISMALDSIIDIQNTKRVCSKL